jgi:hypothetical protein
VRRRELGRWELNQLVRGPGGEVGELVRGSGVGPVGQRAGSWGVGEVAVRHHGRPGGQGGTGDAGGSI